MADRIERITAERIARHDLGWKRPNGEIDMGLLEALCGPDGLTPLELIERVGNEYGGHKFNVSACVWVLTRPGMLPEEVAKATMVRIVERAIRSVLPICDDPTWRAWADRWLSGKDRTAESARMVADAMQRARRDLAWVGARMSSAWAAWAAGAVARAAAAVAASAAAAVARAASADVAWAAAFATQETAVRALEAAAAERRLQVEDFRAEIERFEEHPQ